MEFRQMKISDKTLNALEHMGYKSPTEVQEKAIPLILEGSEIIVRSKTGSGKTAAFGVGLIELLTNSKDKALILAPTRELALQITKELRSIAKNHKMYIFSIYGGQDMQRQIQNLRRGFDIVVATPGRLLDHISRGTIDLSQVRYLVLDEADRMLDMGFKEDIDQIIETLDEKRKIFLFSATIDQTIKQIAKNFMQEPKTIEIGEVGIAEEIEEQFIHLNRNEKLAKLKEILSQEEVSKTIIFVATKMSAEYISDKLNESDIFSKYIHGDKSQNRRERIMQEFKDGKFHILVATDVAARGLHIEDVSHVINYDQAMTNEGHTHRIGRTGRMGKAGIAITFVENDPRPKPQNGGYRNRRSNGYSRSRPRSYSRDNDSRNESRSYNRDSDSRGGSRNYGRNRDNRNSNHRRGYNRNSRSRSDRNNHS